MARSQNNPLRALTDEERDCLYSISRSLTEPAAHVARAKALLAVSEGCSFCEAARGAGRRSGDAVSHLVARFNHHGIEALETRHGGGRQAIYTETERKRILGEVQRVPDREQDGTATWSLSTLKAALRKAPDGLPQVSTYTIWTVLHEAGWTWQRDRTWCATGVVIRKRKTGVVTVTDPDGEAKKNSLRMPTCWERK
jgi:transposase